MNAFMFVCLYVDYTFGLFIPGQPNIGTWSAKHWYLVSQTLVPGQPNIGRMVEYHPEKVFFYVWCQVLSRDCHVEASSASPALIR